MACLHKQPHQHRCSTVTSSADLFQECTAFADNAKTKRKNCLSCKAMRVAVVMLGQTIPGVT